MEEKKVFVYWDNSNIFIEAQRLADDQEKSSNARQRARIHFDNLLRLAHANRPIGKIMAAGSIPPEMRQLWNRMENKGIKVELFDRGAIDQGEQNAPDRILQLRMLEDGLDNNGRPGIIVLLTGDGAGYKEGAGFHSTLERLHNRNWQIEVLSWVNACNKRMREWTEENGVFIALDDFYDSITFMEPSRPGHELALGREAIELNLSLRPIAKS